MFLTFYYKFTDKPNFNYWLIVSVINILLIFPVIFVSISTPAIDRLGIYFIPIQILIFSNIKYMIDNKNFQIYINFLVMFIYLLLLLVWIFFANHADLWIPYKLLGG